MSGGSRRDPSVAKLSRRSPDGSTPCVEVVISAPDEILERFALVEFSKSCGDRRSAGSGQFDVGDLETTGDHRDIEAQHPAQELVASVSNDEIVGPHVVANRVGDEHEKLVSGLMTVEIVYRFQPVNVNEGQGEDLARSPCSYDFALQLEESGGSAVRSGDLVDEVLHPFPSRQDTVSIRKNSIIEGSRAFVCRLLAVSPGRSTIQGGLWVHRASVLLAALGSVVPPFSPTITCRGHVVAQEGHSVPFLGESVPIVAVCVHQAREAAEAARSCAK